MSPRSQGGPTIHDVAHLAGVGSATVSRVINRDPKVRAETRERVLEAIRALNYAPNPAAQQLAGNRLVRLGLVFGNPSRSFTYELLRGALDEAPRQGCQLLVSEAADELITSGVDGVIIGPRHNDAPETVSVLKASGLPVLVVSASGPDASFSTVSIDQRQGAMDVAHHLLSLGHRSFGVVKGDPQVSHSMTRLRGFLDALGEADVPASAVRVEDGDFTFWSGFQAGERLLGDGARPTAIFASNDDTASGVLAAAHRFGIRVPHDLSLVGFGDGPVALELWPALTTIRQDTRGMAAAAIRKLAEDTRGGHAAPSHLVWRHSLVVRESTGEPPG